MVTLSNVAPKGHDIHKDSLFSRTLLSHSLFPLTLQSHIPTHIFPRFPDPVFLDRNLCFWGAKQHHVPPTSFTDDHYHHELEDSQELWIQIWLQKYEIKISVLTKFWVIPVYVQAWEI